MTNVTKVGVSYDDHMNDDAPEVDSFSRRCYQALSSLPFLRRELGDEAMFILPWVHEKFTVKLPCQMLMDIQFTCT